MELIDGYNKDNKPTGHIVERFEAFDKGLWKRTVSCWVLNDEGKVLMQKRTPNMKRNPNKWAKTGGQVDAGETPEQAIKREVKEELGIDIEDSQIKCIDIFKDTKGKRFCYDYILKVNYKIDEYKIQKEEVAEVKYFTIDELKEQEEKNNTDFTFTQWEKDDFYKEMNFLNKELRQK